MSPIINNQAAWIPTEKARVEVGPGPVPNPKENEVVIEVAYAAINPADYKVSPLIQAPSVLSIPSHPASFISLTPL